MGQFLYFVPGRRTLGKGDLDAIGLAHAFEAGVAVREVAQGPGAAGGGWVVSAAGESDAEVGYWPNRQTWVETHLPGETPGDRKTGGPAARAPRSAPRARIWLGWFTDAAPGPADLARRERIAGYTVPLGGDGPGGEGSWLVPVARVFPEGTLLPAALAIGPDGKLVREVLPRFRQVCASAERVWRLIYEANAPADEDTAAAAAPSGSGQGGAAESLTDEEAFRVAVEALSLNYRIGVAEAGALRLLTTANVLTVLAAFVDWPAYLAVQAARADAAKKNGRADTPAGGGSAFGRPGG